MMLTRNKMTLALMLAYAYSPLAASSECSPKGVDICEIAKKEVGIFAESLPMKVSSNIYMEKAFAVRNTIVFHARFSYDEKFLKESLKRSGVSLKDVSSQMRKSTKASICTDSSTKNFIKYGGTIIYKYSYSDMSAYDTITIDKCN